MDRREAIKQTSLLLGFAVSASAVTAVMSGCTADGTSTATLETKPQPWTPRFFTEDEMRTIGELTETIFPKTQTPGAKEAGVPEFVDMMMKDHFQLRDQMEFRRGMTEVASRSQSDFGKSFVECSPDERFGLLSNMDKESKELMDSGDFTLARRPFFATLKELTYLGYFTSEIIGEHHLAYDPIPGQYDGCVPLAEAGKQWSI